MNLADQIEAVARRATAQVVAASHAYAATQRRIAADLAGFRSADAGPEGRWRDEADTDAGIGGVAMPRFRRPADAAEASPHRSAPDE
ncbi:hypothetical protein GTV32_08000 [Gordonia sp. SID5947]|uniref:hypothetical protein n=1 Tax=Gordonia sp. SID5947 TaxID=2690315 RepID=UPI00136C940C|nr:hypothetical protein [Gordonia sp. SID5947]MYR06260.1 hypothetical protein [Gordonia sp. SID5947]